MLGNEWSLIKRTKISWLATKARYQSDTDTSFLATYVSIFREIWECTTHVNKPRLKNRFDDLHLFAYIIPLRACMSEYARRSRNGCLYSILSPCTIYSFSVLLSNFSKKPNQSHFPAAQIAISRNSSSRGNFITHLWPVILGSLFT